MKKVFFLMAIVAIAFACKSETDKTDAKQKENTENDNKISEDEVAITDEDYMPVGEKINPDGFISSDEMASLYKNMKVGDTIEAKFMAEVNEVCQSKGCWMKMDLGEEEAMVKFKDYGFFMPKDIAGKEVILNGKAYIEEMSVEDQRHFAEDAGEPEETIESITETKRTMAFMSDGVLIVQ